MSEKVRWRGGRFSALWPLKAVLFVMRMKGFCKMSGIVGFFNVKEKIMNSQEILMNMNNKLMHRGSDKDGYYIGDNIALGFRTILCGDNQPISFNFEGNTICA